MIKRSSLCAILVKEIYGFFSSPAMLVVTFAYLLLSMALPLYFGGFFSRGIADLGPFFLYLPWLGMILVPALSMRSWAEEFRQGTVELLFTSPVPRADFIIGKFLAVAVLIAAIQILPFPIAVMLGYLGDPDWGLVVSGYAASIFLGAAYAAIGQFASSLTSNQIAAFVIGVLLCFTANLPGSLFLSVFFGERFFDLFLLSDALRGIGILAAYQDMADGLISLSGVILFAGYAVLFLFLTALSLRRRYA